MHDLLKTFHQRKHHNHICKRGLRKQMGTLGDYLWNKSICEALLCIFFPYGFECYLALHPVVFYNLSLPLSFCAVIVFLIDAATFWPYENCKWPLTSKQLYQYKGYKDKLGQFWNDIEWSIAPRTRLALVLYCESCAVLNLKCMNRRIWKR